MLAALASRGPAGVDVASGRCPPGRPIHPHERLLRRPTWLANTVVTEYYPTRESWFVGKRVRAPGIPGRHRVEWLYGRRGLPMEGEGIGADGRMYHFAGPYDIGWVNARGGKTKPCATGHWTNGHPSWLAFGWRNGGGGVTFPLARGGWSAGRPARYLPPPADLRYARGASRTLAFWHSVAVDPKLIPMGSRIFVPAYCSAPSRGWFRAQDTGGAIIARHIDVFRPPPSAPTGGRLLRGQTILVVPPGKHPRVRPRCPA